MRSMSEGSMLSLSEKMIVSATACPGNGALTTGSAVEPISAGSSGAALPQPAATNGAMASEAVHAMQRRMFMVCATIAHAWDPVSRVYRVYEVRLLRLRGEIENWTISRNTVPE